MKFFVKFSKFPNIFPFRKERNTIYWNQSFFARVETIFSEMLLGTS